MKYNICLFDLDGTLTDSQEGILNCAAYALEGFDIDITKLGDLKRFIGPPLRDTFRDVFGFSAEQSEAAIARYRERFEKVGMLHENKMYGGIFELLEKLTANGVILGLATSKAQPYAKRIAEHFKFAHYFSYIGGAAMDGTGGAKKDVVADNLVNLFNRERRENMPGARKREQRVIMIGDRKHDIIGAKFNGIESVGVLWGYGSRGELAEAGADYIVNTVDELLEVLL